MTEPCSAPPSRIVACGFIAPLPSSIGLDETPFWNVIVRWYDEPLGVAVMSIGETALLGPIGVAQW